MILRIYTSADLAQLRGWLLAATTSRAEIAAGKHVQLLRFGDRSVTYSPGSRRDLDAWISDLTDTIAHLEGTAVRRGPIYASF